MYFIKYVFTFVLLNFFSFNVSAVVFSENQIEEIISNKQVQQSGQDFIREFFVAKNPKQYITVFISSKKDNTEALIMEYKIYSLLNEISYHPKQKFLQGFVNDMKQYTCQSFKYHEEGRMQVPVYNIQARAAGIENIWLADESYSKYNLLFNNDPIAIIKSLKYKVNSMSAPQWLGLKNNIKDISPENHLILIDYFLSDIAHLSGLDKFISHYALLTANKEMARLAVLYLDKSNSEFMLRKIPEYFSDGFVVSQLIKSVQQNKNQAFALSMMKPYVDSYQQIGQLLINKLKDKTLSSQAAFALSNTQDSVLLNQLKSQYHQSPSPLEKKQIVFALRINKSQQAKTILAQLSNNFEGEIK